MKGCERGSPKCAFHHIISCTFICKDMVKTKPKKKRKQLEMLIVRFFLSSQHHHPSLHKCKPPVKLSSYDLLQGVKWENRILGSGILRQKDWYFLYLSAVIAVRYILSVCFVVVVVVWESHLNWPDVRIKHWVDKSLSLKEAETLKFITSPTTP